MPAHAPRFPAAISAAGLRFLGHPVPAGEFRFPYGLPTGGPAAGPQRGFRVAHEQDATGQGAPFTPGTVVRTRAAIILRPAPAALPRPVPTARWNIPPAGVTFTRRHQGFTHVRPSPRHGWLPSQGQEAPSLPAGLLLACRPRMGQGPLRLLPRAPHPAVTRSARQGGDGPTRTGPGTTPPASAGPPTAPPT